MTRDNSRTSFGGSGGGSGGPPTGAAGGVLAGTYPNPSLATTAAGTTQATGDNSTKLATDAFVTTAIANAVAGVNPADAANAATTQASDTSGFTYANGASGVGATFTGAVNTAVTIDGFTFTAVGQELLVKNDTQAPSGAFNGLYTLTALQTVATGAIFTRSLDYDTPTEMNNTGAIPVQSGTVNALTSWLLTSNVTTIGTSPLTYQKFTVSPTFVVPGTILATQQYAPGSVTTYIVAATTIAALDTTNATLAFTVPTNGVVDIGVNGFCQIVNGSGVTTLFLAMLNHTGGALVGNAMDVVQYAAAQSFPSLLSFAILFHLTGLTPGALQLDLGAGRTTGGGVCNIFAVANTSLTVASNAVGPLIIQARASI